MNQKMLQTIFDLNCEEADNIKDTRIVPTFKSLFNIQIHVHVLVKAAVTDLQSTTLPHVKNIEIYEK